eukprot:SAG11_NODE_70_length_18450_cov_14.704975_14_plen_88_part_00
MERRKAHERRGRVGRPAGEMELVALEEGTAEMTASDGLAPARCGGLLASLLTPCLAAPGAGLAHTAVETERSFVAAGEALRARGGAM